MAMDAQAISQAALPAALAKAERYRLLNEPEQAESICRDVLAVEPKNQKALVTLLLVAHRPVPRASRRRACRRAEEVLAQVDDEYQRVYYAGIVRERWGLALLEAGDPGRQAFAWLDDAMEPTSRPRRWRRRGTTTRSCAGTRARGSSSARG